MVCPADCHEKKKKECCGVSYVKIPAALGDDTGEAKPENGAYFNALVKYEANGALYFYSNDGIWTRLDADRFFEEIKKFERETKSEVDQYLDDLDVQEEIDNKLDEMVEDGTLGEIIETYLAQWEAEVNDKLATLPVADKSESIVYAFFDETNSHINFYASKDGVKLSKITTSSNTVNTGTDPSLLYKNGKFYMAYSNSSTTYDFSIKVSEDLNTWTQHNINLNLYDASYTRRWAPEWFEDDNGKIYIIISVQYANTEGWGDFRPWIVECTDLETLTFGTPQRMYLTGGTADNHIDATVCKYNGTYHMFIKSEHQTELYTEYYTSINLIDWDFVSVDPCRFGRKVEGQTCFKFNGEYYVGVENYTNRPLKKSYYMFSKTKDFQTFTNPVDVSYPDLDISHGGATIIPKKEFNKLISNGNAVIEEENKDLALVQCKKSFHVAASQLTDTDTNAGTRLGNYLLLFDVINGSEWKNQSIQFYISTATSRNLDCSYSLQCILNGSQVYEIRLTEMYCSKLRADYNCSLAGKMVALRDSVNGKIVHVYMDLTTAPIGNNEPINIEFIGEQNWQGQIVKYTDKFADSLPASDLKYWANGSVNSQSITMTPPSTKARIKFQAINGSVDVSGNINGTTSDRIIAGKLLVNEGYVAYKNLNEDLATVGKGITYTLENYDSSVREYTVLIEHIPAPSNICFKLEPSQRSLIKGVTYPA